MESTCSYTNGKKHGKCRYFDEDGNLQVEKYFDHTNSLIGYAYEKADGALTDTIAFNVKGDFELKAYFKNGKPSLIQRYQNDELHGETIYYHANGRISEKMNYEHGDNEGEYVTFYNNGNPKSSAYYEDDLLAGNYIVYFNNGNKKREETYDKGVQHGYEKGFDENGKLVYELFYRNGAPY